MRYHYGEMHLRDWPGRDQPIACGNCRSTRDTRYPSIYETETMSDVILRPGSIPTAVLVCPACDRLTAHGPYVIP